MEIMEEDIKEGQLAPIVLFCYNRPWHVEQTLEALSKNELADQSILYIYCDGQKPDATEEQIAKIAEVRQVIRKKQWCKEIHIIENDKNKGLGTSIIDGVSEIIKIYKKVIVLEDDLLTSPFFLDYMNKSLDHYEKRKSVFSISALSRPNPERFYPKDYKYDVYVSPVHHPTGWASWVDRWSVVDWSAQSYQLLKSDKYMRDAFNRMGEDWYQELENQQLGKLNIWSVRFALAHFENHAVSICPIVSYINHIGWDSLATNATGGGDRWKFDSLADKKDICFLDVLYEDARIINAWYSFSIIKPRSLWGKMKNRFGRKFMQREEYALKGKVYDH